MNTSNALVLARQLSSFTSSAAVFGDMMDVVFVTHLVERITGLVDRIREVRAFPSLPYTVDSFYYISSQSVQGVCLNPVQRLKFQPTFQISRQRKGPDFMFNLSAVNSDVK